MRQLLRDIEPYPPTCTGFRKLMSCRAFFPGGDGRWQPNKLDLPIQVLFLGSDFNSEANYDREFEKPEALIEDSPATWRGVVRLMNAAHINPEECFFTNAWPCLRTGNAKNTGDPPGAKDSAFTNRCLNFFRLTLREIQPQFVIPLGVWPTCFVSGLDPVAMKHWRIPQWNSIDHQDHMTVEVDGREITFIPAIHPSLPNHRYRLLHKTAEAEAAHIRKVMRSSNAPMLA